MSQSSDVKLHVFSKLFEGPDNQVCFDCNMPGPTSCSYNHGIFLCSKCADSHRVLLPEISKIKLIVEEPWSYKELKLLISGGNSTLREFLTYYEISPDTPINVKYRTKAMDYYRKMLDTVSDRRTYEIPFPAKNIGSEVIKEEEFKEQKRLPDIQDLECMPNPQEEKFLMGTETASAGILSSMFSKVVELGSSAKEKVEEIGQSKAVKSVESATQSAVESIGEGVSMLVGKVKGAVYGQKGMSESEASKGGYLDVALNNRHSYENIDSNPLVRLRKGEIMDLIGQHEGQKEAIGFTQGTSGTSSLVS
ncbi:unnamed protein product [Blepharisma stoltei]|uniref:Arf-GAP domain-containing protein n=1 Tax=Blepharisma stoltei TaxID=1481888 RepID=A0AAU9JCA6_9CILI|nr:unnamed protein product [Blepharisma stoltei]